MTDGGGRGLGWLARRIAPLLLVLALVPLAVAPGAAAGGRVFALLPAAMVFHLVVAWPGALAMPGLLVIGLIMDAVTGVPLGAAAAVLLVVGTLAGVTADYATSGLLPRFAMLALALAAGALAEQAIGLAFGAQPATAAELAWPVVAAVLAYPGLAVAVGLGELAVSGWGREPRR